MLISLNMLVRLACTHAHAVSCVLVNDSDPRRIPDRLWGGMSNATTGCIPKWRNHQHQHVLEVDFRNGTVTESAHTLVGDRSHKV